ncbi:brain and acute leukemia cytoplasmic protein isoform X3 [Chroicocephalus ridibundus]|uniref:brain and acute leukemia cytoplasmic protein isoform X3 n=1 Tax=Chroicocephalus ridibundus TaxID=1192867 RepID=UPI002FDEC1CF
MGCKLLRTGSVPTVFQQRPAQRGWKQPHPGSRAAGTPVAITTGTGAGLDRSCRHLLLHLPGILEDGKAVQTGVTTASGTAGMPNTEKRNNGGPQCVNPMVHGTGVRTQRQNGFRAAESTHVQRC